jgi:two-component system response regulator
MDNIDILLVEDNMDDAGLTIRALTKHHLANHLAHVQDGQEAMDFLLSPTRKHPLKLILLDLKMPKVDGIEVLRQIRANDDLKYIPVVMLTSSKVEQDIVETYKLGVNAYIVKPVEFDDFAKTISDMGFFWMILNEMPKIGQAPPLLPHETSHENTHP